MLGWEWYLGALKNVAKSEARSAYRVVLMKKANPYEMIKGIIL